MTYSGSTTVANAREELGKALAALQADPNLPPDVLAVAQNIARAVGSLFEAERAGSEKEGKTKVRNGLSSLSQTLALLQEVKGEHAGVGRATSAIAQVMNQLYPLSTKPSIAPGAGAATVKQGSPSTGRLKAPPVPSAARQSVPQGRPSAPSRPNAKGRPSAPQARPSAPGAAAAAPAAAPAQDSYRGNESAVNVEANIGGTTDSNFFVGFSGDISDGGVFVATYDTRPVGSPINLLVTLPGPFEFRSRGTVRFVSDPLDFESGTPAGMGVKFQALDPKSRELVLRFIRKRAPMFYDD